METAESDLIELTKEYDKNQEIIRALKKLCKVYSDVSRVFLGLPVFILSLVTP